MTLPFACTPAASSSSGIISVLFNLFMTYHRNGAAVPVFRSSKTSGALISFGLLSYHPPPLPGLRRISAVWRVVVK